MSGYDDLTSDACWPDRTDRHTIEAAAVLAVLALDDRTGASREESYEMLDILGLLPAARERQAQARQEGAA